MPDYSLLEGAQGATVLRQDGDHQVVVAGPGLNPDEARRIVEESNRGDGLAVGDVLEWIAGGSLVAAGFFYAHTRVALACVAGFLTLFYFGQCYATARFRAPWHPLRGRRKRGR